jgi:hypothetical protein
MADIVMTDERSALIEAVARAMAEAHGYSWDGANLSREYANKEHWRKSAQAAIASVIAHATSDEAVARAWAARETYIGARMNPHDGEAMKAAILAALNERQS